MGNKLSPVIIIVLIVVIIALAGLAVSMLTSKDGSGIIGGNKGKQGSKIVPTIEATVNTVEENQEKVIISVVVATEDEAGIDAIILPDGTEVNGETKDYTVTENGTYEFGVRGVNGEQNSTTVEITNIRTVSAQNPYIPDGFEHIGGEVDNGFVIQDTYGNQFVWIPVPTGILKAVT